MLQENQQWDQTFFQDFYQMALLLENKLYHYFEIQYSH